MRLRTPRDLERLTGRWRDPDFASAAAAVREAADDALRSGLRPATQGAGWGHDYMCPDHVVGLDWHRDRPTEHRCPVGGERREGEAFDAGWRVALNARISAGLTAAATAFVATGEATYARHVTDLLTRYAQLYPTLPPNGHWVGKGRVTGQSLEEAVWGIGVGWAYDAVAGILTPAEDRAVRGLLRQIADHVRQQLLDRIHNIECWHLGCLVTLAVLLEDDELLQRSLHGPNGLADQLDEGILADGWWAEGSPSYHYYMLASALASAVALRQKDPDFMLGTRLRQMFVTPLTMLRADGSLPATNDGWTAVSQPWGIGQYAAMYEQGYDVFADDTCAWFLRQVYLEHRSAERRSEWALLTGPPADVLRDAGTAPAPVSVFADTGYAFLNRGDHDDPMAQQSVMLKYGRHGGGHGHPDKLEIDLFAHGEVLAADDGSPSYNSPLQGPWIRQTLSHNTVVLDHASQPEARGRLLAFLDPADHTIALADAEVTWSPDPEESNGPAGSWLAEPRQRYHPSYAGSVVRRTVLSAGRADTDDPGYLVDVVTVEAARPCPIDLAFHHRGELDRAWSSDRSPVDVGTPNETYAHLEEVTAVGESGQVRLQLVHGAARTRLFASHGTDTTHQALLARIPSDPPAQRQWLLLRRRHGRHARFLAVIETAPAASSALIRGVRFGDGDDGEAVLVVDRSDGVVDRWRIGTGAAGAAAAVTVDEAADGHGRSIAVALPPGSVAERAEVGETDGGGSEDDR